MLTRRRLLGVLASCLLAATIGRAVASERSEILTAKGEVAFHTGHPDEARRLLADAVAADPSDASAQYALGVVLNAAEQWDEAARAFARALALQPDLDDARRGLDLAHARTGRASEGEEQSKPWGVQATTGVGYDSNVKVAPTGDVLPGGGQRGDAAFILGSGGYYDVIARSDALMRLEYDFYQTLHPHLEDYNFRSHRVRTTVSYALDPALWVGAQGGYNHYTLGDRSYLGEPFIMPFFSIVEKTWGVTQVSYRHGEDTYFSKPFHDGGADPKTTELPRDGPNEALGLDQTLFLPGGRALSFGYLYGQENPRRVAGNDNQLRAYQGYVGVSVPLWWEVGLDLTYLYRWDDYPKPNSFASPPSPRRDQENHLSTTLRRPITSHLSAMITYYATFNRSNIDVFEYQRHVVSGLLQVTY